MGVEIIVTPEQATERQLLISMTYQMSALTSQFGLFAESTKKMEESMSELTKAVARIEAAINLELASAEEDLNAALSELAAATVALTEAQADDAADAAKIAELEAQLAAAQLVVAEAEGAVESLNSLSARLEANDEPVAPPVAEEPPVVEPPVVEEPVVEPPVVEEPPVEVIDEIEPTA